MGNSASSLMGIKLRKDLVCINQIIDACVNYLNILCYLDLHHTGNLRTMGTVQIIIQTKHNFRSIIKHSL